MSKAIIDPDKVRQFAKSLEHYSQQLKAEKIAVSNKFDSLHDHWQDEKYIQFEQLFEETSRQLDEFFRLAEDYSNYLQRKAQKADQYLEGRYR